MRISDWGSDVCSSALRHAPRSASARRARARARRRRAAPSRRQLRLRAPPARRPPPRAELELELGLERIGGVDGSAGETAESGRASCMERVCQYGCSPVVDVSYTKTHYKIIRVT